MVPVLYEDNHLLVVEKPPNMPVQQDSSGDLDLLTLLKSYIGEKYEKPGAVYLGLVHRLDRPVGGVMVFARTSKAAARLSEQLRCREAHKRYAAVVEGEPPAEGALTDFIEAREGEARVQVSPTPREGAKQAMLRYHSIASADGLHLLDVTLLTGRKHQIRAQLSAHALPILYDQRYHPAPQRGQIALWAHMLTLTHPTKKERLAFHSTPKGEGFAVFSAQVRGLPACEAGYVTYMDDELLVADKREGIEVSRADGGEASLQSALEACFSTLYPLHRIDANTKGLILFARTQQAYEALDALLRAGKIEKEYRCLVRGHPTQKQALLTAYAVKDAARGQLAVYDAPRPGAVEIRTEYCVLEEDGSMAFLRVLLHTGRTHQIRAHLAHIGHPLLGDDRYGDREWNKSRQKRRQQLVAYRLAFPWKGRRMEFWSRFPLAYDQE